MPDTGTERSRFGKVFDFFRRLLRKKPPQSPADPYAYATAPLRRGPKGRNGAAVAEPEDDSYRDYSPRRQ